MSLPKLSTLILRGIKKDGSKLNGELFKLNRDYKISGCCALGAAVLGAFGVNVEKARKEAVKFWLGEARRPGSLNEGIGKAQLRVNIQDRFNASVARLVTRLPGHDLTVTHGGDQHNLHTWVVHKNDQVNWSRERIAAELKKLGL